MFVAVMVCGRHCRTPGEVKDIVIIDTSPLFAADAGDVVTADCHPASWFKVVVERTLLALHTSSRPQLYSVSKKIPPDIFWHFFPNGWEFLVQILHAYYTFLSTLDYKFLVNYLQLKRIVIS